MTLHRVAKMLRRCRHDDREHEVQAQMRRPAFQHIQQLGIRYLPYSELEKNRDAISRFGQGLKAMMSISKSLS